jgi:hypothetical protein
MNGERYKKPHKILTVLAVLSALLFVGISVERIRDCWSATDIQWISRNKANATTVYWGDGAVVFTYIHCQPNDDPNIVVGWSIETQPALAGTDAIRDYWRSLGPHKSYAGFIYGATSDPGFSEHGFQMPFWPLLLLTVVLPGIVARRA